MAVSTHRWFEAQTVWFAVGGLDAPLAAAAVRCGYVHVDGLWRRTYPCDAAHAEEAWENFAVHIGPMLRQAARLDPVPWQDALELVCRRTDGGGLDWWLAGSAAVAIRGGLVLPGDVDLVCSAASAHQLGDLLVDGLVEPVAPPLNEPDGWISDWWGRAFCGARIEWAGAIRPGVDHPDVTDFGPTAALQLESVRWRDWQVRVPPLSLQRAVSLRRGLTDRLEVIDALLQG